VTRATVLLINGEIHAFISPADIDIPALLSYTKDFQPYYAIPSTVHSLEHLPLTANGKIDKKALAARAESEMFAEKTQEIVAKKAAYSEASVETRSLSSSTTLTMSSIEDGKSLARGIPDKRHGQPFRGLRHRIFIVYRRLFSVVWLVNLAALVALIVKQGGLPWLAILTAANLVTCVMIRQDTVINILYTITCSVPKTAPLWIRSRCAEIYHLGGVHSAAGIFATIWLYVSTIMSTMDYTSGNSASASGSKALATLILSWMLCAMCGVLVVFAWPGLRKRYHNLFERIHRFVGWTTLIVFWIRLVLTVDSERTKELGLALVESPIFWMLIVASICIVSSWLFLRQVPVEAEILSNHAVRLRFDYTTPVNGSFTRVSRRPLIEWHSFATIPNIESDGKGYSLIISNAGDWTRHCIQSPPTKLWVRGLPTCGVMRIATLFNRVVLIATGSGIGPVLGHINQPSCPTQLIWSTPTPEATFGKEIVQSIRTNIPGAVIHDTRSQGRPDLVRMGYNLAKNFGAEAVIIIANEKITKKVVYGLQSRGMPAFGAIWDS
jgi:predicted ferric reductase